jgi:ATP-dependent Clp protease ATP-binding subunit ClpB
MNYSEEVKRAIHIAQSIAKEYRNGNFSAPHLFQALLHNEVTLASFIAVLGKDVNYLRDWAEVRIENLPKTSSLPDEINGDATIKKIMEMADLIRIQHSKDLIDPISALAALLKPGIGFTEEQLKSLPLTQKELLDAAAEESRIDQAVNSTTAHSTNTTGNKEKPGVNNALYKYCINKTQLARDGKLDPVIGREREIRMMAEILGRRNKPNVIVAGETGVGKTALVEGFTDFILTGNAPLYLKDAVVFELDAGALIAGASYKGETEDRLKHIIAAIKQQPKALLFIDEIHMLLDSKGAMGTGVANMLKPELARGEITIIGATTNDEYRKFIESDEAFSRRFEVLRIEEPSPTVAIRMIKGLLPHFEKHHQLSTEPEAVEEAVRLAKRYIKDRFLPDSAIDLIDKTMAAVKMLGQSSSDDLGALKSQLELLKKEESNNNKLEELRWFHTQLKSKISHILLHQLNSEEIPETYESADLLQSYLSQTLEALLLLAKDKKQTVNKQDIAAMISAGTGIPIGKLQSGEKDKLLAIEDVIRKRVVGQDHAVKVLADAIVESRSGLLKAGQPIGSFFLLGPTGTGKTELAKALADFLFNDESYLIRFDMSEFKEEHSAALLFGAPPGYVGYEEGGLLVNRIRQKPYSVVLFDEIEKAHTSVYDIFLQIMDEGKLHDRLGKEGDFSNAVVLFTSNIGSDQITQKFGQGMMPTATELMDLMTRHFRPEFLARLTEIVPFAPISEQNVVKIFDIHLKTLTEPLTKQGIKLEINQDAKTQLALSGFSARYGARPIKGVIRNQLRRPISRMIISGEVKKDSLVQVALDKEGVIEWKIS